MQSCAASAISPHMGLETLPWSAGAARSAPPPPGPGPRAPAVHTCPRTPPQARWLLRLATSCMLPRYAQPPPTHMHAVHAQCKKHRGLGRGRPPRLLGPRPQQQPHGGGGYAQPNRPKEQWPLKRMNANMQDAWQGAKRPAPKVRPRCCCSSGSGPYGAHAFGTTHTRVAHAHAHTYRHPPPHTHIHACTQCT